MILYFFYSSWIAFFLILILLFLSSQAQLVKSLSIAESTNSTTTTTSAQNTKQHQQRRRQTLKSRIKLARLHLMLGHLYLLIYDYVKSLNAYQKFATYRVHKLQVCACVLKWWRR